MQRKKLVFFVSGFIVGGIEKVLCQFLQELEHHNTDLTLVWTGFKNKNYLTDLLDEMTYVKQYDWATLCGTKYTSKPKGFVKRILWKIKEKYLFYKLKKCSSVIPEVAQADFLIDFRNGNSFVAKIQKRSGQKTLVWMHGAFQRFFMKNKFKAKGLFDYDKIVCLTQSFKDKFVHEFPNKKDKIMVLPNPFDIQNIQAQAELYIPEIEQYDPFFLHVSRIDKDKDILTLIQAYQQFIQSTSITYKLVFLGEGNLLSYYKQLVRDLGLEKNIYFLGNSPNPYPWMKKAKALILSSFFEGLPTVLIEGQICQTLVVSSDVQEGPDEILMHGKAGVLFPASDVKALAQVLQDIASGKIDKNSKIKTACQNLSRFSAKDIVQNMFKVLS